MQYASLFVVSRAGQVESSSITTRNGAIQREMQDAYRKLICANVERKVRSCLGGGLWRGGRGAGAAGSAALPVFSRLTDFFFSRERDFLLEFSFVFSKLYPVYFILFHRMFWSTLPSPPAMGKSSGRCRTRRLPEINMR